MITLVDYIYFCLSFMIPVWIILMGDPVPCFYKGHPAEPVTHLTASRELSEGKRVAAIRVQYMFQQ